MFTVACFLQSSALLTSFLSAVTLQDSWLAVLFGAAVCLPLIWLYRTLMVMFRDRNLLQILEEVYGPVAGKIIGIAYAWFFFTLTALNLMDMGDFVKITVMADTPQVVLMLICMLVSAWAVRYGIRVVTQYSALFVVIEFGITATSILLLANQINLENFLPMFDQPFSKYIQGTHIIATIPFGELVVLLMIIPNVRLPRRDITRYLFWGVGLGGLTLLAVLMRDIGVLGNTLSLFTLPGLVTLRLVNIGTALSRIEILFAVALIMLLFFKIMFLYYVSVITVAQLMKVKAYRYLVLAVGALIIAYGLTLYPSPVEHAVSAREITPIVWTLFEVLVPLLTFIIARARNLPKVRGV
jgi:spore germination protein KB